MLFALGAAATALDAVSSLASSSGSSPQSIGFSAVDPFEIASPVPSSTAAVSGFGAGSQISPATLNTLLAAQSQSSTGSASTGASDAWQDVSSQLDGDAGASDSTAAASSYNSLAQMFQQRMNAMSFSAPPLSFSV